MTAADGKKRLTDVATTEQLLRLIQSVPSPKAEPFKVWFAEVSTTEISKTQQPQSFEENRTVAKQGGKIASDARIHLEKVTGKSVITSKNAAQLNSVVTDVIESIADDEKDKK